MLGVHNNGRHVKRVFKIKGVKGELRAFMDELRE